MAEIAVEIMGGRRWDDMIQGVDRVLLRVAGLEAAVAYYRDTLGLKLLRFERSGGGGGVAAFGLDGGTELVLHDSPDLPAHGVYFRVADVEALYRDRENLRLKFGSVPRTVSRGKSATVRDPFGSVLLFLDRTREGQAGNVIESAAPASGTLFPGVDTRLTSKRAALMATYARIGRTADDLPYTHHFETLYAEYSSQFPDPRPSRQEVWRHLLNTRKAGRLPRLGEAVSTPPEATDAERNLLRTLLGADIGRRDRLPYSPGFDRVVSGFNSTTRRTLTPHQIWRLVATVAK